MANKLKKMACQALERAESLKKSLSPVSITHQNVNAAPRSIQLYFSRLFENFILRPFNSVIICSF